MKKLYEQKILKRDVIGLALYMIFFLVIAGWIAMLQPLEDTPPLYTNPPDEHSRYMLPSYICKYLRLPNGLEPEVQIPYYGGSYAFFPGLSYILMGWMMRLASLFGAGDRTMLLTARSVNLCFGLGMAFFVWLLGRRLFSERGTQWTFCCGIMYLPQQLFLHTYVNVESMCMLSIAVMLYALVWMWQEGVGRKNAVIFSLGAVLCTLSYYNAYGFLLVSVAWFILCFFQEKNGKREFLWKQMLTYGGLILLIWAVLAGWWFVRNAILLHGDITGMNSLRVAQTASGAYRAPTAQERGIGIFGMLAENSTIWELFRGFVAAYGSRSVYAGIKYYYLYELFFAAAFAGLFYRIWKCRKTVCRDTIVRNILLLLACVITFSLWLYYCYTSDYQVQGRYVLPCVIPLFLWISQGYEALLKRIPKIGKYALYLPAAFSVFMLLYYIIKTAIPAYFL
ncbi:MAG: hypothetical protein IKO10_05035 [Lachnospiraceae bacterium]|nr:hypothetical protein [Lachnospiraceae bacterium]